MGYSNLKIRKLSLLVSLFAILFNGCTNTTKDVSPTDISDKNYLQKIETLNRQYLYGYSSVPKLSLFKIQSEQDPEKDDKKDDDSNQREERLTIAGIDAAGAFAAGVEAYRHRPRPSWPIIIGCGIAGGGSASIEAYFDQRNGTTPTNDSTQQMVRMWHDNGSPAIDLRNPIGGLQPSLEEEYLPTTIGSTIGMYHNYLIAEAFDNGEYAEIMCNGESSYQLMQMWFNTLVEQDVLSLDEAEDCFTLLQQEDFLETWQDRQYESTEQQLLQDFMSVISSIRESSRYDYVCQYMGIIDEAYLNGEVSEESALIINGAISVWFYSHNMWNYYIPMDGCASAYMLQTSDDEWFLTNSTDRVHVLLEEGRVLAIGIPKFIGEDVTEVFFFENTDSFFDYETFVNAYSYEEVTIADVRTDMSVNINNLLGMYRLQDVPDRNDVRYISIK